MTAKTDAELTELEQKFDDVCEWLTNNSLMHPDFESKMKEFKELDLKITEQLNNKKPN